MLKQLKFTVEISGTGPLSDYYNYLPYRPLLGAFGNTKLYNFILL